MMHLTASWSAELSRFENVIIERRNLSLAIYVGPSYVEGIPSNCSSFHTFADVFGLINITSI